MPTSLQCLDIATMAFFGLYLLLTIPILRKHTAKKEVPWIWLSGACTLRIISAAVGHIAATANSKTKTEVTFVISSLVPTLLVIVLTEVVNRILTGVIGNGGSVLGVSLPAEKRSWVNAFALAAVIVGIIGGVRSFDDDADTRSKGQSFDGIAATLVFVQFVLVVGMLVFAAVVSRRQGRGGMLPNGEWKLLICAVGSVPFLFVRTVFAVCVAWNPDVEAFEFPSEKAVAMAVWIALGLVMEVGATGMFVFGGLLLQKIPEGEVRAEEEEEHEESKVEVQNPKADDGLERGYT